MMELYPLWYLIRVQVENAETETEVRKWMVVIEADGNALHQGQLKINLELGLKGDVVVLTFHL